MQKMTELMSEIFLDMPIFRVKNSLAFMLSIDNVQEKKFKEDDEQQEEVPLVAA